MQSAFTIGLQGGYTDGVNTVQYFAKLSTIFRKPCPASGY